MNGSFPQSDTRILLPGLPRIHAIWEAPTATAPRGSTGPNDFVGYVGEAVTAAWIHDLGNTDFGAVGGWGAPCQVRFDASRCSPLYGASTTVQPNALTVNYYIRAL